MTVRTRFAPSPTGTPESVHLGFVIRALWGYALAKQNGGQFILRIEDTDTKRSRKDTENAIFQVLKDFGIIWDEGPDIGGPFGPYRQSERLERYKQAAHKLVEAGFAYYDFDSKVRQIDEIKESHTLGVTKERPASRNLPLEEAKKRVSEGEPFVVRVKIPENRVFEYEDWILKKNIKFTSDEVPDLIILKSDGYPTYHLGVVVDDVDMKITHVMRGQEWISTTPIHLFLYEALGLEPPKIGHFTVILDPRTKKKFSKRDMSAMFGVKNWLDQGYLHEAILNYLMLLGWAPKDNREIFTLDEFVHAFSREGFQKANPTFDKNKLDWFNGYYIRQKTDAELAQLVKPFVKDERLVSNLTQIVPLIKDRLVKLNDINDHAAFVLTAPNYTSEIWPDISSSLNHLNFALGFYNQLTNWDKGSIENGITDQIKASGWKVGDFFMSLRIALCGSKATPPTTDVLCLLGKVESLSRIQTAIKYLSDHV